MRDLATWLLSYLPSSATLTAIFGGAGVVLIWELLLKPRRERQNVAQTIAAEVSVNLKAMYRRRAIQQVRTNEIPRSSALSTIAMSAVAEKLGELPPELLERVIELYAGFAHLNRLVQLHSDVVQKRNTHERGSAQWNELFRRSRLVLESFKLALARTIEMSEETLVKLDVAGKPRRKRITAARLTKIDSEMAREALELLSVPGEPTFERSTRDDEDHARFA